MLRELTRLSRGETARKAEKMPRKNRRSASPARARQNKRLTTPRATKTTTKTTKSSAQEVFVARADARRAAAAKAKAPFTITVVFTGGLSTAQKNAFKKAARRWSRVIVGDLPDVMVGTQLVDDVLIEASGVPIDGPGGILGQAGPTHLRPASAGASAFIPAKGRMQFDTADLAAMQANGSLNDFITHEMGHVLGIGTIWINKGLLLGANTTNPTFTGTNAKKEYGILKRTGPTAVPVENTGGPGTRNSHWRETVFRNELMTGIIAGAKNPMSRLTVASLKDLGYVVDLTKAERYSLPNLMHLAEGGLLVAAHDRADLVIPTVPMLLPEDSLGG
jgi:Leishmanolysin